MNGLKKDYYVLVGATVLLYLALACSMVFFWVSNSHRVSDIQSSRITSCQRTYEGIREVFHPFFRPPNKSTPQERADQAKFNRTIDHLKAKCSSQVKPN